MKYEAKPAILKIKQTGVPPSAVDNTWSYGPRYMRQISRASAVKLCGMYPLPPMGSETVVAVAKDQFGFGWVRLQVQNVSGTFYIASTDIPVDQWVEVFKVEMIEPATAGV